VTIVIFQIIAILVFGMSIGGGVWYLFCKEDRAFETFEVEGDLSERDLEAIRKETNNVKTSAERIEQHVLRIREIALAKEASIKDKKGS
jgi:hypothetical protein